MIRIRLLTPHDLPLGLRLREQAGWNQTEADWRRFHDLQPDGCFVAELDGVQVGTTTTCIFGPVAWVAMVLVDPAFRRRGVGQALLRHALDFLDGRGVRSVRLDATPLGQPLYEQLGFAEEYRLYRYEGTLPVTASPPRPDHDLVAAAAPEHLEGVVDLDRVVTGTDRRKLLSRLYAERPDGLRVVERQGGVIGYLASRPGCRAWQIGPCLALDDAGPLLLADAWRRHAGQRVFIDIPAGNTAAVAAAAECGLLPQRPLLRMCRGPTPAERFTDLWASSGPEKG